MTSSKRAWTEILAGGVVTGVGIELLRAAPWIAAPLALAGAVVSVRAFCFLMMLWEEDVMYNPQKYWPEDYVQDDADGHAAKPERKGAKAPENPHQGAGAEERDRRHPGGGDLVLGGEHVPLAEVGVADEAALAKGHDVVRRDPADAGRAGGAGEKETGEGALLSVHAPSVAPAPEGRKDGHAAGSAQGRASQEAGSAQGREDRGKTHTEARHG